MRCCILFCSAIFLATICECRQLTEEKEEALDQGNIRQKRSDDIPYLQPVVNQLVSRVTALEAKITADEAKLTAQQSQINTLKTKRCETGKKGFRPHGQSEVIKGDYHERRHTVHVNFAHTFPSTPWVAVSLAEMDVDEGHNLRINSGTSAVSNSGFDVFVYEWADTNIVSATVTWIACSM